MKRTWHVVLYYLSWGVFVLVTTILNLFCRPWLWWGNDTTHPRQARRVVRYLFEGWQRWFHATGILKVRWHQLPERLPSGVVYVANHPSLLDATLLLSRIENATCICKPALLQNPIVGPAARLCRYVSGDNMLDAVRSASERVSEGQALLIFPEGTRTKQGCCLQEIKPGFALVAQKSRAPVTVLLIQTSQGLVPRGRKWWKAPPRLPATIDIHFAEHWAYDEGRTAREMTERLEETLRRGLQALPAP